MIGLWHLMTSCYLTLIGKGIINQEFCCRVSRLAVITSLSHFVKFIPIEDVQNTFVIRPETAAVELQFNLLDCRKARSIHNICPNASEFPHFPLSIGEMSCQFF